MWYLICLIIYKCRCKSVTHFKKSQCLLTAFAKVETRVVLDWMLLLYIHTADSNPQIAFSTTRICLFRGQNVSLVCTVKYRGTNLMPLLVRWTNGAGHTTQYIITRLNASSEYHASLTFTATGQTTDSYTCTVSFSSPTGTVIGGSTRQHLNAPSTSFRSSLLASRKIVGKILNSVNRSFLITQS